MSTSTALKTSPSLNVPAAADAPVVKAPVRLAHPRCVLERIKRIQALEAPPRPAPAARTSSEGSASSSTPSTDVDEAWVDSILSGGETADPPTATKPLPSTATKRKSPEVEAEAEPAEEAAPAEGSVEAEAARAAVNHDKELRKAISAMEMTFNSGVANLKKVLDELKDTPNQLAGRAPSLTSTLSSTEMKLKKDVLGLKRKLMDIAQKDEL